MVTEQRHTRSAALRSRSRTGRLGLLCAALCLVALAVRSADDDSADTIAQEPLFINLQRTPAPHLMITVDDSRSMASPLMTNPLRVPDGAGGLTSLPVDPLAADQAGVYVLHPGLVPPGAYYPGVLAANPLSDNVAQMAARSGDVNALYYNPDRRYLPWFGLSHAPADIRSVEVPRVNGSTVTLDLSRSFEATEGMWCLPTQNRWILPNAPAYAGQYPFIDQRLQQLAAQTPCWLISSSPSSPHRYWTVSEPLQPTSGSTTHSLELFIDGWPGSTPPDAATLTRLAGPGRGLPYHPGLYYRLRRNPATGHLLDGRVPDHYELFDVNDPARFNAGPKSAARTDCAGERCTQAEEQRNFASWFAYHHTRLLSARSALGFAVTQLPDALQLGWGGLNQKDVIHTPVRPLQPEHRAAALDWIYRLWPTDGATPMLRAAEAVSQYFRRPDAAGPWGDTSTEEARGREACRRAFHLMVTDGQRTDSPGPGAPGDVDGDGHLSTLADYVARDWARDLRPDLRDEVPATPDNPATWQHIVQMLVGFGDTGDDARRLKPVMGPGGSSHLLDASGGEVRWSAGGNEDLLHAAINSRGRYFSVHQPGDLGSALSAALAATASGTSQRATAGALASGKGLTGNRLYRSHFETTRWSGDITAHGLTADGQTGELIWSAENRLPVAAERNIITWDTTRGRWFTADGLLGPTPAGTDAGAAASADLLSQLGTVQGQSAVTLVEFLRGERSAEQPAGPLRARAARSDASPTRPVLGDVVNSQPLYVRDRLDMGYRTLPATQGGTAYATFLARKAARAGLILAGANDGMLHAFLDTAGETATRDGQEVLAYVPRALLGSLHQLADPGYGSGSQPHRFFVDGSLREADAWLPPRSGEAPQWRNLVLGSLGAGGRAVFALDTTDMATLSVPDRDQAALDMVRWEVSDHPDLGHVATAIETGVLPDGTWVAVFGNGPGSPNGRAVLMVVNLDTGAVQAVDTGAGPDNGLGGVTLVRNSLGQILSAYAGDLQGRLWRFDIGPAATPVSAGLELAGLAGPEVAGASASPDVPALSVIGHFRAWLQSLWQAPSGTRLAASGASPAARLNASGAAPAAGAGFHVAFNQGLARLTGPDGLPQAITQAPAVVTHPLGGRMVIVGTGRLFSRSDTESRRVESVYGVWDAHNANSALDKVVPVQRTALVERTLTLQDVPASGLSGQRQFIALSGSAVDWSRHAGWFMDLVALSKGDPDATRASERVVLPVVAESSLDIRVDTTRPPAGASAPCKPAAADGAVYRFQAVTGLTPAPLHDTNGDGVVDTGDTVVTGYRVDHGSGTVSVTPLPAEDPADDLAPGSRADSGAAQCPAGSQARLDVGGGSAVLTCLASSTERRVVRDRLWRRLAQGPF